MKITSKMKTTSKMKMTSKMKTTLKTSKNDLPHPPLKRILPEIFLMTSHLNSQGTTDIKPEMLSGVQTGNGTPHHMIYIIYAALPMREQTEKKTFSCKDD